MSNDEIATFPSPEDKLFKFAGGEPVTSSESFREQDWHFYINGYSERETYGEPEKIQRR